MTHVAHSLRTWAGVGALAGLSVATGCSEASSDGTRPTVPSCSDLGRSLVCLDDAAAFDSDFLIALDRLNGEHPADMEAGVCSSSATAAGSWSLCIVPIDDDRQVVIGRGSGDDLVVRTELGDRTVEFPLRNAPGRVTVLSGVSQSFEVIDSEGSIVGGTGGPGLAEGRP